ncbi:MAG: AI-2E family transporter [Patescibacteria group bacterium]|jgi:predicted PurR-regulated permease PerM
MKQHDILDISTASVLRVVVVLLAIGFLYFIRDIIAIVFVSIIIAAALSPTVDRLTKWRVPRTVSIILIYLIVLGALGGVVYFVLPPMVDQVKQLADSLPAYFTAFTDLLQNLQHGSISDLLNASQDSLNSLSNFLGQMATNLFDTTVGFFNSAAALVMVFILTLYFLLDENGIKKFFVSLFPVKQKSQMIAIANKMGVKLGGWLRGQLILAVAVGLVVYIGMLIIGMPYALTLGILAGILEIIPVVGPIIAAIPAILIAFTIAPTTALIVTAFYIFVQEMENKLLVPKVMQHAVGLNPVTIIIIILIGAKLMGVLGILLSVPVASVIYVLLEEWPKLSEGHK